MPIIQVGGPTERAAAFRTGRIIRFYAARYDSPGHRHAAPHHDQHGRLSEAFRFSLHLFDHDEELFGSKAPNTMRRLTMALIEATHFSKRAKKTKKFIAKYTRRACRSI